MADRLELANVISALRTELASAWADGAESAMAFEAGPITIELTTEVQVVDVSGKVSAKFWVLSAEASANHGRTNTQTLTFSITPRLRSAPSESMLIGGSPEPGVTRRAQAGPESSD
ncbi:trypco2 family protein [Microbacterium sp. Leaf288]|uniref:trypco2 family protein n=1 Tax=Microbacterium sp. Leaf288 TaxID=1736323 RepID=UPI0012F8AE5E|nr:trypco2 family protein [Microbacterium sp. Leaf288]